ncbi:hypothetical protein ASG01_02540 [Chryseobacterium sp. Leaf180]|nr:hypothetical protein ASG01_02540 [Chryseobacterium sp. Leaf180]
MLNPDEIFACASGLLTFLISAIPSSSIFFSGIAFCGSGTDNASDFSGFFSALSILILRNGAKIRNFFF